MAGLLKNIFTSSSKLLLGSQPILREQLRVMIHLSATLNDIKKYQLIGIDKSKYTVKKFKLPKTGGRNLEGRIETNRIGGGHKRNYRVIDTVRAIPKGAEPKVEKVLGIQRDPNRSARIAVVAGEDSKRYVLATENMKEGDIIASHSEIPVFPVQPKEGNAHPLGALPLGTVIHNVEKIPGKGGYIARAAGTRALVQRKLGDTVVIRMPSMREICLSQECMATVGRVSNVDNDKKIIGSPNKSRWLGIRPKSGKKTRKTGYHGRKIHGIKPMSTVNVAPHNKSAVYKLEPS